MTNEHFFAKRTTYQAVEQIAVASDWVMYVALGATIDRTGTTWESLAAGILHEVSGRAIPTCQEYVRQVGPERASTTAEILLRRSSASETEFATRLANALRPVLYGPRRNMSGRLLQGIAQFAYVNAARGGSTLLVTPNYDEYLYEQLSEQVGRLKKRIKNSGDVTLDPLKVATGNDVPDLRTKSGHLRCVHLHGYVPSAGGVQGVPVVGELTYNSTRARTVKALSQAFKDRKVMIVGSSLADGPLCEALISTQFNRPGQDLFALLPKQGDRPQDAGSTAFVKARLDALGVQPIRMDHFGQVGQFMHELAGALSRQDGQQQRASGSYPSRYNRRLRDWWSNWSGVMEIEQNQTNHHQLLAACRDQIRDAIGASPEEELKVEVWSREDPNHERQLRLWATSIGPWNDSSLAHKAALDPHGSYFAAQVFCLGSPTTFEESGEETFQRRWRTYFGVPIWREGFLRQLPVGVMIVASMRPYPSWHHSHSDPDNESSIVTGDLSQAQKIRTYLERAGGLILDPKVAGRDDLIDRFSGSPPPTI